MGKGELAKDARKAVELYQHAANLGEARGMDSLGVSYMMGEGGLAEDQKRGVELFQRAVDLGHAHATYHLGLAYEHGSGGLTKNENKAVEFYQRATDLGDPERLPNSPQRTGMAEAVCQRTSKWP